jgi:alpha-glucoside transport system substrate-binding protein
VEGTFVSKFTKILAVLFAFALLATACGSDNEAAPVDSSAIDQANAARDAAEADAAEARDEAEAAVEAAQADAQAAQADAADARDEAAAATDAAAEDTGPVAREFEGEIVRVTGPERSPEEWNSLEAAMGLLEEQTGMQVIYTGSADWEGEINVQLAANNPPDISVFPQPGKLADFARNGLVLPLPDEVLASVAENWNEAALGFGMVDGTQFGVPNKNDLKSIVWHKPARFADNGYEIPETWDALLALTDQMIADGNTPWCIGIESGQATGWTFTDWTEDLVLRFQGPEVYDQWVTNEVKFADERIVEIFDEILSLWNTPDAVFASGGSIATTNHSSGPAESLAADDCMMVRQASFFSGRLPEGSSEDVGVFYFPSIDENRPVLGSGTLAGAFKDTPAVWAVMEFFGSAEYANARQIAQREAKGGGLSGFNTANLNVDRNNWAELEQSFIDILQTAAVLRFDGSDLMPADVGAGAFWTEATSMVNGEKSTADAAAAIDAAWPADD